MYTYIYDLYNIYNLKKLHQLDINFEQIDYIKY